VLAFAQTAGAVSATTRKTEKVRLVAELLKSRPIEEAGIAALFFSGRVFPAYTETTLQVGGALLWQAIAEVSGAGEAALAAAYRRHGDLGAAAHDVLARRKLQPPASSSPLTLPDVVSRFAAIASARGPAAKLALVIYLLARASTLEAKYLVKLMAGELRIGLREGLVEEAIAKACDADIKSVQRANMLLGDIGETLRLAAAGRLSDARMRLFHPIGFMLATPAGSAEEAFAGFPEAAVEDKYDGIRAQAHIGPADDQGAPGARRVRLFSRTLDEVTGSFPELVAPLGGFSEDLILDGEIVAWSSLIPGETAPGALPGRALPFSELQKRLGRKRVTPAMMRSVPVAYVAFDLLYAGGELQIDRPLRERAALLDQVFARRAPVASHPPAPRSQSRLAFEDAAPAPLADAAISAQVLRAPAFRATSAEELDRLFDAAQARGNEGLMIKDLASAYTPGRRGRAWLKMKRELATLDVVVTLAEYGHGKRVGLLSDYTFAVRSGDELLNVGKAYSGLTDAEILELTQWFLAHTLEDRGFSRLVEPRIVLEVAFNAVMRSDRHSSGFALRFPRILRIRTDKPVDEIDTLDRVREIFQQQSSLTALRPSAGLPQGGDDENGRLGQGPKTEGRQRS